LLQANSLFQKLADFSYQRNFKEAIGFYIAYLVLVMCIGGIVGGIIGLLFGNGGTLSSDLVSLISRVAGLCALALVAGIGYFQLRAKGFTQRFEFILLVVISIGITLYGGGMLGLIPLAFLSTRTSSARPLISSTESSALNDSFQQEDAQPTIVPPPPNKISYKAVIISGLVDVIASAIIGLLLALYLSVHYSFYLLPADEMTEKVKDMMHHVPFYQISILIGSLVSIYAGYLAASIAKRQELLHGALSSFLCITMGVISLLSDSSDFLSHLMFMFLSPLLGLAGGYIYLSHKKKTGSQ
jgi:hypothetical protein